ncbi:MAG TPA: hypothetical protein VNR18_00800, partial [Hyphomicrobiales bacterium]|nr:hypothetical protein [Hyphomicrobiales bacterium]
GTHPDWLLLEPEKRQITVGQIRELIEFAHNTSQRGTKVLVLHPAEAMNLNAANAVLKILEEPPPGTVLILVSHHSGQLLATLRSRCQQLEVALPSNEQALAWLQQMGASDAQRLLHKARGAPLRALALRDNDTLACQDAMAAQLLALLLGEVSPIAAAKNCEKFAIQTSIEFLLEACRDLAATAQGAAPLRDEDLRPLYAQLLQGAASTARLPLLLHAFQRQVLEAYKVVLAPNNANPLLILEALFGAWVRLREKLRKTTP